MIIKRKHISIFSIIAALSIGTVLGVWQTMPPGVNQSSPMYPSYVRMMANLQKMIASPHPSGSKEIEIVRAHLLEEIKNMGLTPDIQSAVYSADEYIKKFIYKQNVLSSMEEHWEMAKDNANKEGIYSFEDFHEYIKDLLAVIPEENFTLNEIINNYYMKLKYSSIDEYYETVKDIVIQYDIHSFDEFNKYIGEYYGINVNEEGVLPLYNIIVKLDAPQTDRGVLFVAHYDSEHETSGAADNMLAVVSLLEALRSQAQNNALKTNLYFLFTDGEELGLLGSFIFVEEYPELKDKIDMVVNFDARGNSGPLLLFETSPNAYNLAEVYKESGAWLYGFSASTQLYHMMQDNIRLGTDFMVFLKENYNGLNFAVIEGVKAYHMYNLIDDSYENLNRNTAWHHLQVTLSLAGYTANNNSADLQKPSAEAVFFPFLPGRIVLMTAIVSHIICAFSCALALAVITFKIKNRRIKPVLPFILMCLLITVSIISAVFFTSASYLFYIPLLLSAVASLIKKWYALHLTVKMASYIIVLMLYVPLIISIWQAVIVPMML